MTTLLHALRRCGVLLLLTVAVWTAAPQAAQGGSSHYRLVSRRMLSSRVATVVDEIWQEADGRWRLERRSEQWDNGLIAIFDGKRVLMQLPAVPGVLELPASEHAGYTDPVALIARPVREPLKQVGEEAVLGRPAVLLQCTVDDITVKRWVDKATGVPLREERYSEDGTPLLVLNRTDLPAAATDQRRYVIEAAQVTSVAALWRAQAVSAWMSRFLPQPVSIPARLPGSLSVESAELLEGQNGSVAVVRLYGQQRLVSMFIAPAAGPPPVARRLLARGQTVQARRIGSVDITLVGSLSQWEANTIFYLIRRQMTPAP